jgi:hypothetical protein
MTDLTPADFFTNNADENGFVDPEKLAAFLNGTFDGETTGEVESGKTPEPAKVKEPAADKPEEEAVILTKDGKHTIPYSTLADAREEARLKAEEVTSLSAKIAEQEGLLAELREAQATDQENGNTEAVDDLMAELAEDYPGVAKEIAELKATVKSLLDKEQAAEIKTAETTAQQKFNDSITAINPDYPAVKDTPEFWTWLDDQPRAIREAEHSGDPQRIADAVKLYTDSTAGASDKANGGKDAAAIAAKVAEAIKKADGKPAVRSLSDVPTGDKVESDEREVWKNMTSTDQMQKLLDMPTQKARNEFLRSMM